MSDIRFTNLERVLNEYGLRVVERYRNHLASPKGGGWPTNATGSLSKKVKATLEEDEGHYTLWIDFGAEYWEYLEYGTRLQGRYKTKGKPPGSRMIGAIKKWLQEKPVPPYKSKSGKPMTRDRQASLIAWSIYHKGTPPLKFLEKSLESDDKLVQLCTQAAQADIQNWINEILKR